MSSYNDEQSQALDMVRRFLSEPGAPNESLIDTISSYLEFRTVVDEFLESHFNSLCTAKCYEGNLSACCSREGIITFFADVVINALAADKTELDAMARAVSVPNTGVKCVYLGEKGCLWKVKPIVCQMFLCNAAKDQAFAKNPDLKTTWEELKAKEKTFTWPDRSVLFDDLEKVFMNQGLKSPLMYMHTSPGLMRVKQKASTQ